MNRTIFGSDELISVRLGRGIGIVNLCHALPSLTGSQRLTSPQREALRERVRRFARDRASLDRGLRAAVVLLTPSQKDRLSLATELQVSRAQRAIPVTEPDATWAVGSEDPGQALLLDRLRLALGGGRGAPVGEVSAAQDGFEGGQRLLGGLLLLQQQGELTGPQRSLLSTKLRELEETLKLETVFPAEARFAQLSVLEEIAGTLTPGQRARIEQASPAALAQAEEALPVRWPGFQDHPSPLIPRFTRARMALYEGGQTGPSRRDIPLDVIGLCEGLIFLAQEGALSPVQRGALLEKVGAFRSASTLLLQEREGHELAELLSQPQWMALFRGCDRASALSGSSPGCTSALVVDYLERTLPPGARPGGAPPVTDHRQSPESLAFALVHLPPELALTDTQRASALELSREHLRVCDRLLDVHQGLFALLSPGQQAEVLKDHRPPTTEGQDSEADLLGRLIAQLESTGSRPGARVASGEASTAGLSRLVLWERLVEWDRQGRLSAGQASAALKRALEQRELMGQELRLACQLGSFLTPEQDRWVQANQYWDDEAALADLLDAWLRLDAEGS